MDPILALIAELYSKMSQLASENADLRARLDAATGDPLPSGISFQQAHTTTD